MTLIDLATVLAGWAGLLWSPPLRTTRTLAFLGALTIPFVAAGLLGLPGSSIVRIVLVSIYLLAYWRFLFWLAGVKRPYEEIDARVRQAVQSVTKAQRGWAASYARGDMPAARTARLATARACASAVAELDGLDPPTDEWREVVRLLTAYLVGLETAAESGAGEAAASTAAPTRDVLVALNEQANKAWHAALYRTAARSRDDSSRTP